MDAGPGHVEIAADEGGIGMNLVTDFVFEIVGNFTDDCRIHAVEVAFECGVLHDHGFQGHVAGALPDSQHGAVDSGGPIEPGRSRVGDRLVEIIVAVPFQHVRADIRIVIEAVNDAGNRSGQGRSRVRDTVTHGVTGPNFDRDASLAGQFGQLVDEGHYKAIEIRPCDILQMTARDDAHL